MKVVINRCFGGFSLSARALAYYAELNGDGELFHYGKDYGKNVFKRVSSQDFDENYGFFSFTITEDLGEEIPIDNESIIFDYYYNPKLDENRDNPLLVKVVEDLGEVANTQVSSLEVVEIPDGVDYVIKEYDGNEWVAESHRTWG